MLYDAIEYCPCIFLPPFTDRNRSSCRLSSLVAVQSERSFKDYLAYLPPLEIATEAVVLLTLLGSVFYTK